MRMRTGNLRLRPAMQKKLLRHLPYILIQCTWGIIQTIAGFVMFLISTGSNHAWYNGAVATFWNKPFGISLGLFIFIPPKARFYNSEKYNFSDEEIQSRLLVHEYGHTYQSLILGPLYFLVAGLPSVIWGMVKRPGRSYFSFYAEKWANHLGEKHTGLKSMEMIDI